MSQVLLRNIKKGQKFYWDYIIYTMEQCNFDLNITDTISFIAKEFKIGDGYLNIKIHCTDAINYKVYRFIKRDEASFNAGFKRAIQLISNNMLNYDLVNLGIDDDLKVQIKMMKSYQDWKLNKI